MSNVDAVEECVRLRALNAALNDALAVAQRELVSLRHALEVSTAQYLAAKTVPVSLPNFRCRIEPIVDEKGNPL